MPLRVRFFILDWAEVAQFRKNFLREFPNLAHVFAVSWSGDAVAFKEYRFPSRYCGKEPSRCIQTELWKQLIGKLPERRLVGGRM